MELNKKYEMWGTNLRQIHSFLLSGFVILLQQGVDYCSLGLPKVLNNNEDGMGRNEHEY